MRTVYKYPLTQHANGQHIEVPRGSEPLFVGINPATGWLAVWVEVDPDVDDTTTMTFIIVGTGSPLPDIAHTHFGSVVINAFVFHVYRLGADG